eukprot:scaffold90657_cov31-Tisochrysis_lutea.AAC.3
MSERVWEDGRRIGKPGKAHPRSHRAEGAERPSVYPLPPPRLRQPPAMPKANARHLHAHEC